MRRGLTRVELDGGGTVESTDEAAGRVAVSVHPWDLALGPATGSARNQVRATVSSLTTIGNRTRVGLTGGLVAEVTSDSVRRLGVSEGEVVNVVWKAAATRLLPLDSAPP